MGSKNKRSILYREAPLGAQILIYSAILIFLIFGILLLVSMDDIVDGWFETRMDSGVEYMDKDDLDLPE
ncbi:MAG: hypothetical protein ACQESA_02395 [Patescibacteria group bacterium]